MVVTCLDSLTTVLVTRFIALVYLATCSRLPEQVDAKTGRSDQRQDPDDNSHHDHPRRHYNSD